MRLRPWAARRSARQATLHRLLPAEFFSTAVHQQPQRQQQLQLPRRRRRCHRHSQSGAFVHMFSTSRDEGISATSNSNSSTSSTSSANPEPGIPHGPPPSPAMDRDFNAPFGHSAQGNSRQSNHSESYNNARWSTNHAGYKVPDPSECVAMPRKYRSASNDVLSVLAAQGLAGARKERLLREIMAKDGITWPEAREKLYEINLFNDRFGRIFQMPFRIGIMLGVSFGFGCIPLVFHKDTAVWFNQTFVHEELPDDLSNFWQVGEWTWGWMEPALGTLSFTLLSMQLTRQYMLRMQWGTRKRGWRARARLRYDSILCG